MRHLIGKQVWLMPTGNNAKHYGSAIKTATITKVAKVNVSFIMDGWTREEKLRISEYKAGGALHLHNECNGGFTVFESLKDVEEYKEAAALRSKIRSFIIGNAINNITLESLREINKLLGLNKEGECK